MKEKNSPQIHLTAEWGSHDASQRTYSCMITTQEGNIQSRVKIIIRNKCLEKSSPLNNSSLFSYDPIPFQVGVTVAQADLCVIMAVKVALSAVLPRCAVRRFFSPLPERCSALPGRTAVKEGGGLVVGWEGGVCAGQDVKQPGYIIARALIMYDTGSMLQQKVSLYDPNEAHRGGS